jgi:hypothetical protein
MKNRELRATSGLKRRFRRNKCRGGRRGDRLAIDSVLAAASTATTLVDRPLRRTMLMIAASPLKFNIEQAAFAMLRRAKGDCSIHLPPMHRGSTTKALGDFLPKNQGLSLMVNFWHCDRMGAT